MDIKSVTVTGGKAVFSPIVGIDGGDGENKRLRRTRKQTVMYRVTGKLDEHGEALHGGEAEQLETRGVAQLPQTDIKKISMKLDAPATTGGSSELPVNTPLPTTKVLLGGKKLHRVKVLLTKKRQRDETVGARTGGSDLKAHKPARKIQLGLNAIKKNVTRAKRITRTAKTLPIETIRAELVKVGIIKESSKAPESVLRQMYADAKTVSTRSL